MDLRRMTAPEGPSGQISDAASDGSDDLSTTSEALRCSAKGCRRPAVHAVRWNNPTLHAPERRKVWLACDEHETTLRDFLSVRGFYRDTVPVADLSPSDG